MAEDIVQTKRCCTCKETKLLDNFHRCRTLPDGLQRRCKECVKRTVHGYNTTDQGREKRRLARRAWLATPLGKERAREAEKKRKATPEYKAKNTIHSLVRSGRMPRVRSLPCLHCGKPATGYHHHLGYEREHWKHVIPLCSVCHKKADSELRVQGINIG